MPDHRSPTPAFGQADLTNCEREQIHLAGSIQPHGALLVLSETGHVVAQASANAAEFLSLDGNPLGRHIGELEGDLAACISPHLNVPLLHATPLAVRCRVGGSPAILDVVLHRPPQGGLVVELERAGPPAGCTEQVEDALQRVLASLSVRTLCNEAARIFRKLTGYDRVMVYRFDQEGHGEVVSEERKADLEPFLGNHYPASDIPQIARRLYERNRVRVLVDVNYTPVPVAPDESPITGQQLDMSLCSLRSISPLHIQYLKNMGVGATLVVSLVVGGRLWGLVACHHYVPRIVHFETRMACELLAEAVATRISALESFMRSQADLSVRRLEQRMVEAIAREGDWRNALFDSAQSLLQPLGASGAALLFEGQMLVAGEVPGTQQLRELALWLDEKPRAPVITTASLGIDEPSFASLIPVASGVAAAPLSGAPGEYLLWFRPEQIRTVTWGGNPSKAAVAGATPLDLSPRRSFAQWHERVERTSEPWTETDLTAARLIGDTVKDVILQFRSVGMLIAQDQLDRARRRVQVSELPVVIADFAGRVLLTNDAFQQLLRPCDAGPQRLADLPALFSEPAEIRGRLRDLLERKLTWRGEVVLGTDPATAKPLLVRADPVFSAPGQASGFVLLFTDLTEQKAAEVARSRFQERIIERSRLASSRIDAKADLVFQTLLSSVVENAQLAALEISDGVDTARMPEMLESVRASVTRTERVLEHLIWHARSASDGR